MGLLDIFLGNKNDKIRTFVSRGALIVDVRSETEFKHGSIKNATNIPLQKIIGKAGSLKKLGKPIITCCASGIRSAKAAKILKVYGIETINGGGWKRLEKLV